MADTTENCGSCSGSKYYDGMDCYSDGSCSDLCVEPACEAATGSTCADECQGAGFVKNGICYNTTGCTTVCVPPEKICEPVAGPGRFADVLLFDITSDDDDYLENQSLTAAALKSLYNGTKIVPVVFVYEYNDSVDIVDMPSPDYIREIGDSILDDSNFDGILFYPWRVSSADITKTIADVRNDSDYNESFHYVFDKARTG